MRVKPVAAAAATLVLMISMRDEGGSVAADPKHPTIALAPVEVIAAGFKRLSGVAVAPDGAVLVTDEAAGTLTRIDEAGGRRVLLGGLHGPAGVAVDGAGNILVAEAGRRIVRVDPGGVATVIASTHGRPRAVAVDPQGRIWVAVRKDGRHGGPGDAVARLEESGVMTEVAAGFVDVEGLAAANGALYVAMARMAGDRGHARTALARLPIREDGVVVAVEPLASTGLHRTLALGVDMLGRLLVGGIAAGHHEGRSGVLLKRDEAGRLTTFARGPGDPAALAFAPNGDLIVAEPRHAGRVLRFRAPPPPVPAAPAFTNKTPLAVRGRAQPGDAVQLFAPADMLQPSAAAIADRRGEFTLTVPLAPNAPTELLFRATASGGRGLTGSAAAATVTHDDRPPRALMIEPLPGAYVRGAVTLRARGEDEASGVDALTLLLDDAVVSRVENGAPPAPLLVEVTLDTGGAAEGLRTLTTAVADRAGNEAAAAQLLVVDRTPPDTQIVGGPPVETGETDARFTVAGTDVWSPALEFSWRLDEGGWSPFGAATTIDVKGLRPGPHRFEAAARDLSGNADATPATQTFTVRPLRVRILEPADGAIVTTSSIWIRGTVEAGSGEVTVHLALPSPFDGSLAAPVEGGTFAMEVPTDLALTTLTVVATDGSGGTAEASVSVVLAPDGAPAEALEVWPPGGLAPLTVRIGLHGFGGLPVSIDLEGNGTDEFTGALDGDDVVATYAQPGVHLPAVRIMMPDGSVLTRRGLVEVYDRAVLDARLQAVWGGFREALRNADVDAAVSFIAAERRQAWAAYLRELPPDALGDVDQLLPGIALVEAGIGGAQYEMVAERDGLFFSYAVWFRIDADGRWRLWRF